PPRQLPEGISRRAHGVGAVLAVDDLRLRVVNDVAERRRCEQDPVIVTHQTLSQGTFQLSEKSGVKYHRMPRTQALEHRVIKIDGLFRVAKRLSLFQSFVRKAQNARIQQRTLPRPALARQKR